MTHIVYRGPSLLNGEPIVVVVLAGKYAGNSKTGHAVQTYILADNGERPTDAMRTGADAAACGDCKHRFVSGRTCYVVVRQGPTAVWTSLQRGLYADAVAWPDYELADITHNRFVRIGTYGDPAAVPFRIWSTLTLRATAWVGYTHQWRRRESQVLRHMCMASVDSPLEMVEAQALGWRTFRVRTESEPLERRESVCPASGEAGHKMQCIDCRACNGTLSARRGNVAIVVHGNHPKHREARLLKARDALVDS